MLGAADDAAVQAAYDEKYGDGFGGVEFNASHILVETEEEAAGVIAQLDEGADFAALAKEKSTGPSGPGGGSLGWFGEGRMVAEFETAVKALDPGQVSPPVQTQFGWHVITLNERRQAEAPELNEVRSELQGELREQAVAAHIKELVDAANVERPEIEGLDHSVLRRHRSGQELNHGPEPAPLSAGPGCVSRPAGDPRRAICGSSCGGKIQGPLGCDAGRTGPRNRGRRGVHQISHSIRAGSGLSGQARRLVR